MFKLLAVSFLCAVAGCAAPGFSIEDVMSAPFASSLVASPEGGRVAWVLNMEGRRNIWVAQSPAWKARQITQFNQDDGLDISELTWTPDGKNVLFTRGADLESGRGDPNPTAAVAPAEHALWIASTDGSHVATISTGTGPAISADGQRVWFIRKGGVSSAKLDGSDARKEFEVLGGVAGLTWSPDGRRLAFTNGRKTHGYIGVFTPGDPHLRFLDPSVDTDGSPIWSPDSTKIAFVRTPASPSHPPFGARREGYPWSIRCVNLATGGADVVFRADPGPGSVYRPLESPKQIFWIAGDRIVFPWEKTGWLHLYRTELGGHSSPLELTPGEGEVENATVSDDRRTIYFNSNIGELDGRHLGKISADAAVPQTEKLQTGTGVAWSPTPVPGTNDVALLASSYNTTAHAEILSAAGKCEALAPETIPARFPQSALRKPESVLLPSADGLMLHAQLFLPATPGKHPALVFFHGGSRRQMLPAFHYMYYYSNAYAMNQWLASQGYAVLVVNYRSGIGYGLDFREALQYGATGASEYNDVQGAGLYLHGRSDVVPNKIGAWGGSYGGYLTALALARSSDLYAAGVDFHGVHDWNLEWDNAEIPGDTHAREEWKRTAFQSSPLAFVDQWKSPVLLIHGDDDRNVNFTQTVRLVEALRTHNVAFEQLIFPDEIHDFLVWKHWVSAYAATGKFFSQHLDRSN